MNLSATHSAEMKGLKEREKMQEKESDPDMP